MRIVAPAWGGRSLTAAVQGIVLVCAALTFAAAAAPAWADAPRPSVDAIVRYFDTIVFGAEIDQAYASKEIAKWDQPLRISIQGQATPRHREIVGAHARTLADLTGLKVDVLPAGEKSGNVTIAFVPRSVMGRIKIPGTSPELLGRLAAPGGCYFITYKKPARRIIRVVIVVNIEREDDRINHCILEELTQSAGLPNDSNDMRPSLFSDYDYLLKPSRIDTILIKTLYDPRMKAGLSREDAQKVAKPIIAELDARLP